ncbi:hypothetical protein DPEC_G00062130 [Dallia pectoralis]|uniref:Uncharacterized protein n=1 Tax=Dallia pectoralis TaxID=75939 RepID=A0ACC2H7H0_DALPE|nr:hypothetical protein DPEC_G00062130 [Dallia pectoralis]
MMRLSLFRGANKVCTVQTLLSMRNLSSPSSTSLYLSFHFPTPAIHQPMHWLLWILPFQFKLVTDTGTIMANCISVSRLILLAFLGLWVATIHSDTAADPVPTLQGENQDTMSGGGASDQTTKDPFHDREKAFTFTSEYDDTTHTQIIDEDEGVLGPGAITAIVIAVFLGASVLLALIVITLRKFTAS